MATDKNPIDDNNLRQGMSDACASGDVATLECLIQQQEIRPGDRILSDLLYEAVKAKQVEIVKFLLGSDSSSNLVHYDIGVHLVRHPHAEIADLICQRYHNLPNMDPGNYTPYFVEACDQPPEEIADVLRVFIKHGANVNPYVMFKSPMCKALRSKQPMDIITMMVERAKEIDLYALRSAVDTENPEIVRLFLSHPNISDQCLQDALKKAMETKNKEIIEMVQKAGNERR